MLSPKFIIICLLVICLGCHSANQTWQPTTIAVASSTDIGEVSLGMTHELRLLIVNTGQNPMKIADIMVPCSCTNPIWDKKAVDPQKKTEVLIEYTPGDVGTFEEEIMLTGNFEPTYVKVTGNVRLLSF